MIESIKKHFAIGQDAYMALCEDMQLQDAMVQAAHTVAMAFSAGGRLFIAGNGGSAADAQHFAAELVGYYASRQDKPLSALALTTDTSFLTAWGNDDDFRNIFKRQLTAHGREEDIFFAITTSGQSENILRALDEARRLRMTCIGLLGRSGGAALACCDIALCVPADLTSHVQELHIAVIHALCGALQRS